MPGKIMRHTLNSRHRETALSSVKVNVKHLIAMGHHLPYGITQCYLPPDTGERAPPNPARKAGTQSTLEG